MNTSEVYDLVCFMNRKKIRFPLGTEIIMQSKSNKDYELTLEFNDAYGVKDWKFAIDPVPHSESTMSDWMSQWEVEQHPAYNVTDWAMEVENQNMLLTALQKYKKKAMLPWDKALSAVDTCELFVFEYPEDDDYEPEDET